MVAANEEGDSPMEYVRLGGTGLYVSKICAGCMTFGSSSWMKWVLEEEASLKIIKACWDAGINFFDTADMYSNGESERILGVALKKFNIPRDQIVIASKVYNPAVEENPGFRIDGKPFNRPPLVNKGGLSRKHIFDAVDASLRRLGVEYIDLYQIHRWDKNTPIEETMEALNDLVRMGKVRYIGASSMWAWQFSKAQAVAEKNGWAKFVSMQNYYNLAYREEEREMNPMCLDSQVALIPWSPLARGLLTFSGSQTTRSQTDSFRQPPVPPHMEQAIQKIAKAVSDVAEKKGCTKSQVCLAWLFAKGVTSPIVGISKVEYIEDLIGSFKVKLDEEDLKALEEAYVPRNVWGHS